MTVVVTGWVTVVTVVTVRVCPFLNQRSVSTPTQMGPTHEVVV